jgi:cyclohexanone monooxygenase
MGTQTKEAPEARVAGTDLDAVVIGAGFGGLYMLHKLRDEQGLNVRAFDKASDVGGTWYWNRYPGALSDSESFVYCYSFDKEPQILAYLEHVADRFDLRSSITFNTKVVSAHFDEARNHWVVRTDTGERLTATYVVTALGLLSVTNIPNIKGRDRFRGEQYHSGNWPKSISYDGKRVAVIGTGSTGTQIITAIAPLVKHLTVFQRSPQYTVPVGNGPVTAEYVAEKKRNYDAIWRHVRASTVAMGFEESTIPTMSVSAEERRAIFQKAWDFGGGFRYAFETFNDIITDEAANHEAAEFIRGKIAEIVTDPETARKLTPPRLLCQAPALRQRLLRDLQPAQCQPGRCARDGDRGNHREGDPHGRWCRARNRHAHLRHRHRCG